ncbi:carbohydrate ABC transporter permease [Paenibacillus eucommiae]|uniref:Raffinose/stachyose/melibiose transport system permease protein n=1 Tax=Paenibacillus eucommiae TaxID=1355755 RepID=A0ABS4J9V4_9BACL|nr:sugar ABC transporter permease [Paenibacillus eucommiae]MBP1996643.1 raffinose/stachyose/melibiose transport system permease protein [Paenibacillus eucommiae]
MRKAINYVLIAPALLISLLVVFIPGVLTMLAAFTDWNGVSTSPKFIGLQNFIEIFDDKIFWKAIFNNAQWTVLFITIPVVIGLLTAMLLLKRKNSRSAYQLVFLFPYVLAPATNAMLWLNIIFNPVSGVVGYLKNNLGLPITSPLSSVNSALYAVAAVDIWHYWGFLTVVYLAALRQTPKEQLEAAELEGCNGWQLFRYVYFPSIKPTFSIMLVMIIIFSFLTFDYVYLLTGGGPAHSTEMLSTYAYTFAFSTFQVGKAASVALFMSVLGLLASCLYIWLSKNELKG